LLATPEVEDVLVAEDEKKAKAVGKPEVSVAVIKKSS